MSFERAVKKVSELTHGDETVDFGVVTHREGRKVWFEQRIVTFPSDDELVSLTSAAGDWTGGDEQFRLDGESRRA